MAFAVVKGFRFVIEDFEAIFRVRLVVDHLVLSSGVHKRVPALHVTVTVGHLMAFLWIFMVAGSESELVAFGSMDTLFGSKVAHRMTISWDKQDSSFWVWS